MNFIEETELQKVVVQILNFALLFRLALEDQFEFDLEYGVEPHTLYIGNLR